MLRQPVVWVVALLVGVGCGKDSSGGGGTEQASPAEVASQLAAFEKEALPAINKAVPADGPKLEFEAQKIEKEDFRTKKKHVVVIAAAPKGWKKEVGVRTEFKPSGGGWGFFTEYYAGTDCHGRCKPQDWKATFQRKLANNYPADRFETVRQEELTDLPGKLLIAKEKSNGGLQLAVGRWKDGAEEYYLCTVKLSQKNAALVDVFAEACKRNVPLFLQ